MNVRRSLLKPLWTTRRERRARRLRANTHGATAVEYGLILAVVVLVMMTALISVADVTTNIWNNVSDKVTKAR